MEILQGFADAVVGIFEVNSLFRRLVVSASVQSPYYV